jgi:aminocarboxymuconate-semialdehyde decarboxylase
MTTVDMHSHFLPREWILEVAKHTKDYGVEVHPDGDTYVLERSDKGRRFRILPELCDTTGRLGALASMGIDAQLVAPPTPALLYDLDRRQAQAVARLYNETISDIAKQAGGRFIPAATVPMHWPDLAEAELEYAVKTLGFRVLFSSTSIAGVGLEDERFSAILGCVAELGIPLQLHPASAEVPRRLQKNFLPILLGNPIETTIAAAELITGGVLDRHPGLRVILAHGGGAFPFLSGRMQYGYAHIASARSSKLPPRDYLRRFYFDTVVHDPTALRFLADTVGDDRLVIGTDAPYEMADKDPIASLERAGLADNPAVLGENALQLLGGIHVPGNLSV